MTTRKGIRQGRRFYGWGYTTRLVGVVRTGTVLGGRSTPFSLVPTDTDISVPPFPFFGTLPPDTSWPPPFIGRPYLRTFGRTSSSVTPTRNSYILYTGSLPTPHPSHKVPPACRSRFRASTLTRVKLPFSRFIGPVRPPPSTFHFSNQTPVTPGHPLRSCPRPSI